MKKLTPMIFGNARFTLLTEGVIRLEYSENKRFNSWPSILIGNRKLLGRSSEIIIEKKSIKIKTSKFDLEYIDDGKIFSEENLSITHLDFLGRKSKWFPGKKDMGNLGSVSRSLDYWTHCGGPQRFPVEGILSKDGAHFIDDEAKIYWNSEENWPEKRRWDIQFDGYFFAYGKDFKSALQDFVTVFGRIPMIPKWAFGFWYSRYFAYRDKDFIQLVKEYRKRKIPIDVMVIDTDWRKAVWGGYDWNEKYFSNPKKTLNQLHDMNVKTSLNDHPGYDNYDGLPRDDSHIPEIRKRLGALPHQGEYACDWSSPDAVKAWKDILLSPFFKLGMDFWWVDGWCKPQFAVTPLGGVMVGGIDSQLWLNHHYYEVREESTNNRGLILSRWGGLGSHRYPVQFSGDTPSTWEMLKEVIAFTVRSSALGAIYWSHDIGGFFENKLDEELFIRWVQFGAFSPIFRTHSNHGVREPWLYSDRATKIFRKYTRIRYALAPYFYALSREAYDTGLPIIRPLFIEYNGNNGGALNQKGEYTIGRDLLVIPADTPSTNSTKVASKRAYIPPGRWFELEGYASYKGHYDMKLDIPLDIIPLFVREGAIIPTQKVMEHISSLSNTELQFDIFPSNIENEFSFYEDDGETKDYERGKFSIVHVKALRKGDCISIEVKPPKGNFKKMLKKRNVTLRVRIEDGEKVFKVEILSNKQRTKLSYKLTNKIFAGEVSTGHNFVEIKNLILTKNRGILLEINLG